MISIFTLYCSRRCALEKNFSAAILFFETGVGGVLEEFFGIPSTVLVSPQALSRVLYTLSAIVPLIIEENH